MSGPNALHKALPFVSLSQIVKVTAPHPIRSSLAYPVPNVLLVALPIKLSSRLSKREPYTEGKQPVSFSVQKCLLFRPSMGESPRLLEPRKVLIVSSGTATSLSTLPRASSWTPSDNNCPVPQVLTFCAFTFLQWQRQKVSLMTAGACKC